MKVTTEDARTIISEHNHAPHPEQNEAKRIVAEIRRRAVATVERPRQIIQQSSLGVSLQTASTLPSYTASQRAIARRRKRNDLPYANVTSINDIAIPVVLQKSTRGANFLLWDSGMDDEARVLMFGTTENLNLLQENEHWFIDGTVNVSPALFMQVFTIHALFNNSITYTLYIHVHAVTYM